MTAISDKYESLGGEGGFLGRPTSEETRCPDGVGYFRHFESGSIYWHPASGAHEVHGAIREKWSALGWELSNLGYPVTDESGAAREGRFNHFMGGSIYFTWATGACSVYGPIRDKWRELEWEHGPLGFPVSDPTQTMGGELRQRFQGGLVGWTPQNGTYLAFEPQKYEKYIRVFLVRFDDVSNPPNYTLDFFNRLFFSNGQPVRSPDGGQITSSVFDYFTGMSDGYLRVVGDVIDWTDNPLRITEARHWNGNAESLRGLTVLGAVVAPTLRERGIRTLNDLSVGGRVPDGLVFYHTDVWGGGAQRWMSSVYQELVDGGRTDLWDDAWNEWIHMPLVCIPCCQQDPAPMSTTIGTFERVPEASELRWTSQVVLMHEMAHLVTGMRDLYGPAYQWGTWFELMGEFDWGISPPSLSSLVQEYGGWFNLTEMPRRTHKGLIVEPFDTHSIAYRFQSGPMNSPETITLELRTRWDLHASPPTDQGNALFVYRTDPQMRQASLLDPSVRRHATIIRRPGPWGEAWGIAGAPGLTARGPQLGNSLNHLGEAWWEFRNIQILADGSAQLDAEFQPVDLLRGYAQAIWSNGSGRRLQPSFLGGAQGNVILINRSLPIEQGLRYNHILSLHPEWVPNGKIRGSFPVTIPSQGARLYLTVALSEEAEGSDGFTFRVSLAGPPMVPLGEAMLTPQRNIRTLVIDLSRYAGAAQELVLEVDAGPTAVRDWVYLLEAYVVPTSGVIYDFVSGAPAGRWRSNSGEIVFGRSGDPTGEANHGQRASLQNGFVYSGGLLFTHPAWRNDGFVEGLYPVVIPWQGAVFRAEVGFDEGRTITENGVRISASFTPAGGEAQILVPATVLDRRPAVGEVGLQQNPVTSIAAALPANLAGATGQFALRVEADGSAAQDWVWWAMARLTTD